MVRIFVYEGRGIGIKNGQSSKIHNTIFIFYFYFYLIKWKHSRKEKKTKEKSVNERAGYTKKRDVGTHEVFFTKQEEKLDTGKKERELGRPYGHARPDARV